MRLSYANVVSTAALLLATTGTAVAAKQYLITSSTQIRPGVIAVSNLSRKAVVALHGSRGPRGFPGPQAIADGSISTPQLADAAVTGAKIAPGAVTHDQLGTYAVQWPDIANGAIHNGKLDVIFVTNFASGNSGNALHAQADCPADHPTAVGGGAYGYNEGTAQPGGVILSGSSPEATSSAPPKPNGWVADGVATANNVDLFVRAICN